MIGQTVSHYQIVRKIGEGGMGAVYEARDLKLPRSVALKFLPQKQTMSASSETRFLQEARIISTLEHPNIAAIHDIDETEAGDVFIVMPYYQGRTLSAMIQEGPLDIGFAIDLATQIGRGLTKAHDQGIVHRDIKPANILVTHDGVAKILDFGVAILSDKTRLTNAGGLVGTIGYMSPEQATSGDIDHRTDIWSLGVVMYEMLAGQRPFRGKSLQAAMFAILNSEPTEVITVRSGVPSRINEAIGRALQKSPEERFQRMSEFIEALQGSGAVRPRVPALEKQDKETSIAVLPFDDLSPQRDHEYLSDGLTEDIITHLSKLAALRVISRNSAIRLKGTQQELREIAQSLNVQYVLRGSLRRAEDNLRISAQLIDVDKDKTLWAEKYAGRLEDVFDMQEKVARAIANALQLQLTPLESKRVARHALQDPRAYELYLRARREIFSVRPEGLQQAIELLNEGLEITGDNVQLLAGLAHVHFQFLNTGLGGPEHLAQAEHYVDRVLALEPHSAHGHRLRGLIEFLRHRFVRAAMEFAQALAIDRNDPDALFWMAHIYLCSGQMQGAAVCIDELLNIDPLTPINWAGPAWIHFFEGRFNAAVRAIREVYEKDPSDIAFRYQYYQMLVYAGQHDLARDVVQSLQNDAAGHPLTVLCSLLSSAAAGDAAAVDQTLTPELAGLLASDPIYAWSAATSQALLGRTNLALDWLEKAVAGGLINYPFLAQHDRLLDSIRSDQRFQDLLAKVKQSWELFDRQTAQTLSHYLCRDTIA